MSTCISRKVMLILMLGVLSATFALVFNTVSTKKSTLVPVRVRVK